MFKKLCLFLSFIFVQNSIAMQPNTFIAFINGFNLPIAMAITPNSLFGYVSNASGSSVTVVDLNPVNPIIISNIAGFNNPGGLAITPDGNFAYVCNLNSNSVLIIDANPSSPTYNTLIAAPNLVGLFSQPNSIAITPDGLRAYVTNATNNSVSLIDTSPSSPTYNTVLVTPALNGVLDNPFAIVITPDAHYAYVSNLNGSMSVIDINPSSPTYNTLVATTLAVNAQPEGFAITPNGLFAYVSDGSGADVTIIQIDPTNPALNTVSSPASLANAFHSPNGVAITPDGNSTYVTNFIEASGGISSVSLIDTNPASPTYNTTLSTPDLSLPFLTRFVAIATTPNGRFVYALDAFNNNIGVLYTGFIAAPINFSGCILRSQNGQVNHLTWTTPTTGTTPTSYKIYSDAALTQLVATIPATSPLQYDAPSTQDTYYIVSVDELNNASAPASTTVTQPCIAPPLNFSGCKMNNLFLLQKIRTNRLTWSAPTVGASPVSYKIYRDAALTELVATIPATDTLQYDERSGHTTYYIVSIDNSGNVSTAASTTINQFCSTR